MGVYDVSLSGVAWLAWQIAQAIFMTKRNVAKPKRGGAERSLYALLIDGSGGILVYIPTSWYNNISKTIYFYHNNVTPTNFYTSVNINATSEKGFVWAA